MCTVESLLDDPHAASVSAHASDAPSGGRWPGLTRESLGRRHDPARRRPVQAYFFTADFFFTACFLPFFAAFLEGSGAGLKRLYFEYQSGLQPLGRPRS